MPGERVLIDTNVLVYATDTACPHCPASSALLGAVASGSLLACVSVVSSPKRIASARPAEEAWGVADSFAQSFEVLMPPADLYQRASVLGRRLGLKMQDVFDLAIAITALESGVGVTCSYDSGVFSRVPGITVRVPTMPTP
jgi:predicted nucleic acid-binding protein